MNISDEQLRSLIILDLIHNRAHVKNIIKDLETQKAELLKKEKPEFHEDIQKEFYELVKQRIMEDLSKRLNLSPESIKMVCDEMNIKDYIEGS